MARERIIDASSQGGQEDERYDLWQPALLKLFSTYIGAYPNYYEIRVLLPDGYEDTRLTRGDIPNFTEQEKDSRYFQKMSEWNKNIFIKKRVFFG